MRLHILVPSLLTFALLGCEADAPPSVLANGVDIYLPDGASLALDGVGRVDPAAIDPAAIDPAAIDPAAIDPAAIPTASEARATSPAPTTAPPAVVRYRDGGERATVRPMDQRRRYHLAWLRITVPQPDGGAIVTQSHRATSGSSYWAEPSVRRVAPGDAVPVPDDQAP